jgi:hypothetical protein
MLVPSASEIGSRRERWLNASPAVLGLLLWSLIVLVPDGLLLFLTAKTVAAQWFPSVPGEITHSAEQREANESVDVKVRFRYVVNGQEFTGQQLNFFNLRDVRQPSKTQQILDRYPVGQRVDVIYNPHDPSDSALDRTLNGMPLSFALFLLPFNLLMVGGWSWISRRVNALRSLPLRRESDGWSVLPTNGQPGIVALTIAGLVSFVAIFVAGIGGWSDNLNAMISTWLVVVGLSGLAYWHTQALVLGEQPVLRLNDRSATVIWTALNGAPEFSIARSRVSGVEINDDRESGGDVEFHPTFSILLRFTGDDGQPAQRVAFHATNCIEAMAMLEWLQEWIGPNSRPLVSEPTPEF